MPPAIPVATYRLQLTPSFGFDAAAALVPYLKALGISHLYASPFLKARAGSTHGYDIVDHTQLNPEFGGEEAFARLSEALRQADIGLILDFVPNHMGVGFADNVWWLDVLEWGQKSPYAASFDIEWDNLPQRRPGVLLPLLGRPYGAALEGGEIELRFDPAEGSFSAWYFEHRLPIAANRYSEMLKTIIAVAASDTEAAKKLLEISNQYRGPRIPSREQAPALKRAIAAVEGGKEIIERGLEAYRADGDSPGTHALHHLLERQHYRLAHWRLAATEINYRRFFDVNSFAGLRVEDIGTFRAIHQRVARLISEGQLHGLRLDHIDGLRDPAQYLRRLNRLADAERPSANSPLYIVVEKILADGESMPRFPGMAGTTGYEWVNVLSRALLDDRGLETLGRCWTENSGISQNFAEILREAKRYVLDRMLASEFTVLSRLLRRVAAGHYRTRDFASDQLQEALRMFVIEFPVYRTYATSAGPSENDRSLNAGTISRARARWSGKDEGIFDFLSDAITLDLITSGRGGHSKIRVTRFAMKLQQFTGPMMAKALEDTAFYRFHRLIALNEVGGNPAAQGISIEEFHRRMRERQSTWPHGMTATATHDTKRGEDARARILALSEIADDWTQKVAAWRKLNARFIAQSATGPTPSAAHEYMLYQALIGGWPLQGPDANFLERVASFAEKAAREGKQQTSWTDPDERYEAGLKTFLRRILDRQESTAFLDSFEDFARKITLLGALNSLSQVTLKATMPGVPDFYQGTEFWDLSFVDPDNRRPVDFPLRAGALGDLGASPDWNALSANWADGKIKLALTHRLLALRQECAELFRRGDYQPLQVNGAHRDHVIAFSRSYGSDAIIVAVGRLFASLTEKGRHWPRAESWNGSLTLMGLTPVDSAMGQITNVDEIPLATLFKSMPVAILRATRHARSATRKSTAGQSVERVNP
jgi:(1->4)-alpha-D-glucan 1-alpha-D-glucosylmutase